MPHTPTPTALPPVHGIVPARYASTRFPGKPLAPILGRPMFVWVCERAAQCPLMASVTLATDDARIAAAAREHGIPCVMTRADHASGTDRVHEAATLLGIPPQAVVVNIQGDEPALDPAMLTQLAEPFADPTVQVTTLAMPLPAADAANPDRVKVVLDNAGNALYFSRAPIPYPRDGIAPDYLGHVGLYAFRFAALARFTRLAPSPLEQREKLEQLRLLENGVPIRVVATRNAGHGVDRPEDVAVIERILREAKSVA
ncbi:MAG: 3-deoxy-manno-octulosonate cytidylyltransferase [Desulfovibrionaceae bacterium]